MAQTYLFQATAIYKATHYTFNESNNVIDFNAPRVSGFSPRNVWLLRQLVPGQNQVQYLLTFEPNSEQLADTNTLQGLYVEQDGLGVMIDCISITDFNSVANGTTTTITPRYGSAPDFVTPTPNFWCITRSDDGSGFAHDQVVVAYIPDYVGNVRMKSNVSGVSVYTVSAYGILKPRGTDTVAIC